jgi:AraC family transcriptional regulator
VLHSRFLFLRVQKACPRNVRDITVLFENEAVRVRHVRCAAAAGGCGAMESSSSHTIVFPETGVFVKHLSRHESVVADGAHALFFTAEQLYRVSHPATGGDTCIVLEFRSGALAEALREADPAASESPQAPFRVPAVGLPPRLLVRRRLLRHRLVRHVASALEVEETVAELVRETARVAAPSGAERPMRAREASRRTDIARATQATLAGTPTTRWTLAALARRVDCSPFHLAHVFRHVVGMPIHQYHLRTRLVAALDDVLDSERGLSEIGIDLGFTHHSHFSNAFRRAFGVTPSSLRRHATASDSIRLRKFLTAH